MAALSGHRIRWTYTDDAGHDWAVSAEKAITDQGVLGGSLAALTVPDKPAGIKMRRMTFRDGAGHSRVLPIYDQTVFAALTGLTLNVNILGNSTSVTGTGHGISEGTGRNGRVTTHLT